MNHNNNLHIWCPFAPAINKYSTLVERRTLLWARQFKILNERRYPADIQTLEFGSLAARAHPNAELEPLQIVADWFCWLFLLDDECDETGMGRRSAEMERLHDRFLAILRGGAARESDPPLVHALHDLRVRMQRHSTSDWLSRFTHTVDEYFAANRWEAKNRLLAVSPTVAAYLVMRASTSAVFPCFELFHITDGIDLNHKARTHAVVQGLSMLANSVICLCNDIVSVNKEHHRGDTHNLVIILQKERRLSKWEAMQETVLMHNETVAAFLELSTKLNSLPMEMYADIMRYIDCLKFWMRANLDWSWTAARYQCVSGTAPIGHYFQLPEVR